MLALWLIALHARYFQTTKIALAAAQVILHLQERAKAALQIATNVIQQQFAQHVLRVTIQLQEDV